MGGERLEHAILSAGYIDDIYILVLFPELFAERDSVRSRHIYIQEHRIEMFFPQTPGESVRGREHFRFDARIVLLEYLFERAGKSHGNVFFVVANGNGKQLHFFLPPPAYFAVHGIHTSDRA